MNIYRILCNPLAAFWRVNPALYYALCALMGVYAALVPCLELVIPITLSLIIPLLCSTLTPHCKGRLLLGVCVGVLFFGYAASLYRFPTLPQQGVQGVVHITPTNFRLTSRHAKFFWRVEGRVHHFFPNASEESGQWFIKNARVVCNLGLASPMSLPLGSSSLYMQGTLYGEKGSYFLKTSKNISQQITQALLSPPHLRYFGKRWLEKWLQGTFADSQIAAFLTGLLIGEVSDPQISGALGRFGLLHIMAVSGLHFSLGIAFLLPLLRLFFTGSMVMIPLLCILSAYVVFLGPNPSVLRAFGSVSIYSIGQVLGKSAKSCNTLGVTLLVFLLYEPSMALMLGFQLSFLATSAILMLYAPVLEIVKLFLRSFPLRKLLQAHFLEQIAAIMLSFLQSALALSLAVHLAMVPVILYVFGVFPPLSLIYNLFFPTLVSVSVLLLLLGLSAQILFLGLGGWIHSINEIYTRLVLNVVLYMPTFWDGAVVRASPSLACVVCVLSVLFIAAVYAQHFLRLKEDEIAVI